jgi:uncharacterized protein
MSDLLPLFPLPETVLFPSIFLPLHVFEPRYCQMVGDALAGDRLIGMVLLQPGWKRDYEGRPPVFPVGCTGVITHVERLSGGHFNIVLRGTERFRIVEEDERRSYRRAVVELLPEVGVNGPDRASMRALRAKLEALVGLNLERLQQADASAADQGIPASMADAELVNALAQHLDLEPLEKQALLEEDNPVMRAGSLVDLLEMKSLIARNNWALGTTH